MRGDRISNGFMNAWFLLYHMFLLMPMEWNNIEMKNYLNNRYAISYNTGFLYLLTSCFLEINLIHEKYIEF